MSQHIKKLSGVYKTLSNQAKPKLQIFWKYAKVELTPPTPAEIPEILRGANRIVAGVFTGSWKKLTVKEAWVNILVTTEVGLWFYMGECIGKRHLIGYDV